MLGVGRLKIDKSARKDQQFYVYGWYKGFCEKWKWAKDFDINNKNIHSGYRDGIWHCNAHNEKIGKEKQSME